MQSAATARASFLSSLPLRKRDSRGSDYRRPAESGSCLSAPRAHTAQFTRATRARIIPFGTSPHTRVYVLVRPFDIIPPHLKWSCRCRRMRVCMRELAARGAQSESIADTQALRHFSVFYNAPDYMRRGQSNVYDAATDRAMSVLLH